MLVFKFLHKQEELVLLFSLNYLVSTPLSLGRRWQNLQTPAVHNVGRSSRCSCRGIQHFGQHLDQLSPRWNSNAVLLQTGLKDFVVGNMTTFIPRCGGEGEGGGLGSLARWRSRQGTCQGQRCELIFVRAECLFRRTCSLLSVHVTKWMELIRIRIALFVPGGQLRNGQVASTSCDLSQQNTTGDRVFISEHQVFISEHTSVGRKRSVLSK